MNLEIASILGTQPLFIKAAPAIKALCDKGHKELLIHTGQNYDDEMSATFFKDIDLPELYYYLNEDSVSKGLQTGRILGHIEEAFLLIGMI